MPPNAPIRAARIVLLVAALLASAVLLLRSFGANPVASQTAEQRLEVAERARQAAATRAMTAAARAAAARAAAAPPVARAEVLRTHVSVLDAGRVRVQDAGSPEATVVPVPPLVIDRLRADSVAIRALSLALMADSQATAAQEERLVAEANSRDAARLTITQLEHQRSPRCGRRCGMLLGAAGILALGIAVDQTRKLLYH